MIRIFVVAAVVRVRRKWTKEFRQLLVSTAALCINRPPLYGAVSRVESPVKVQNFGDDDGNPDNDDIWRKMVMMKVSNVGVGYYGDDALPEMSYSSKIFV